MTENEFFASLKLITGEEILGYIELHEDGVMIENALLLEDMSMFDELTDGPSRGLKLSKWIKSSIDNTFFIDNNKIITISELKEPGLTSYKRACVDIMKGNKSFKKEKTNKKYNGYHSTVNDARMKFERLFKDF